MVAQSTLVMYAGSACSHVAPGSTEQRSFGFGHCVMAALDSKHAGWACDPGVMAISESTGMVCGLAACMLPASPLLPHVGPTHVMLATRTALRYVVQGHVPHELLHTYQPRLRHAHALAP
jgi:hypothetical protein